MQENIQAIADAINNGITLDASNNTITVNNQVRNMFKKGADIIQSTYGQPMTLYPSSLRASMDYFRDGDKYNALRRLIVAYEEQGDCAVFVWGRNSSDMGVSVYTDVKNLAFIPLQREEHGCRFVRRVSLKTMDYYDSSDSLGKAFHFIYNGETKSCELLTPGGGRETGYTTAQYELGLPYTWYTFYGGDPGGFFYVNRPVGIPCYSSWESLRNNSVQFRKYYTTNNWNNFITNEGDEYTINEQNYNPYSYEDIENIINKYYEDNDNYPDIEWIIKYIEEHRPSPEPTVNPTPTPNPYPTGDYPIPTPKPTQGPDYDPWAYPSVSGNGDDTTGWSFWDFLKGIVGFLSSIVKGIGDVLEGILGIPQVIADFFTIDTDQIQTALNDASVSMNSLKNEVIPAENIKSGISALNISEVVYPKLTINTPEIIRQYYDEEEIILLDFEKWAKYFTIVRLLLKFSFWFAFIYYTLASVRPHVDIGS